MLQSCARHGCTQDERASLESAEDAIEVATSLMPYRVQLLCVTEHRPWTLDCSGDSEWMLVSNASSDLETVPRQCPQDKIHKI